MLFGVVYAWRHYVFMEKKHKISGLRAADLVGKRQHGRWTWGEDDSPVGTPPATRVRGTGQCWEECGRMTMRDTWEQSEP